MIKARWFSFRWLPRFPSSIPPSSGQSVHRSMNAPFFLCCHVLGVVHVDELCLWEREGLKTNLL